MLSTFVFLLNLISLITPVQAQINIDQYQSDASYQQSLYNQSHSLYLEKKQIHSQYNSIATEKELLNTIKNTLNHRENLLSAYLLFLRSSMEKYKPASINKTQPLQQQLFNHQTWSSSQPEQISLIQNQNQLNAYNQSFSQQYVQIQISIDKARVQHHINHQQTIIKQIRSLILALKAEQSLDQQAQNWINQVEQDLQTCQQHLNLANQETQTKQTGRTYNDFYSDSLKQINKSKIILNKTVHDLQSLIKKFS